MSFYLIRHAKPEIDTTVLASEWRLSHQGKIDAKQFVADKLPEPIDLFISSHEPKAIETAQIMAHKLEIDAVIANGLQEHQRENIPYFPNPEHFQRHIKNLFAQPNKCVFGSESATQALTRFQKAISTLLMNNPIHTLGIVSHGTVISLLVSKVKNLDGHSLWQTLKLPDIVKIDKNKFFDSI